VWTTLRPWEVKSIMKWAWVATSVQFLWFYRKCWEENPAIASS
jgi:hypothetical protein